MEIQKKELMKQEKKKNQNMVSEEPKMRERKTDK